MPATLRSRRWSQIAAWAVASLFVLGFFFPPLGAWTGPVLAAWFIGTQKPWRGFLWLAALAFFPALIAHWRQSPWIALAALIGVLPFLLHRLTSPRLPGFLSTLPLPLWGAVFQIGPPAALVYWFAAVLVWMWNREFRAAKIAAVCAVAVCCELFLQHTLPACPAFRWICLAGALLLSGWALLRPGHPRQAWADRPEVLALLRSPHTGNPLQLDRETLVGPSGERFPIYDGIPAFLSPQDLTGSNRKYNRLYETIAGFYDDVQRVWAAFSGMDRDAYVMSYLGLLEIKPGDSVLETSVGTGLNFKYLPRAIQRFGLDLSAGMLANCQANLRRWEMEADLFLGNAEMLPFADSSFDVVFHTGGINFFNDRAKAIREMIRVAKPGTRLLIADETEEHVKSAYEHSPITRGFFKNRKQPVAPPIDLVPSGMQEIRLDILQNNRFYALTFRKPPAA